MVNCVHKRLGTTEEHTIQDKNHYHLKIRPIEDRDMITKFENIEMI